MNSDEMRQRLDNIKRTSTVQYSDDLLFSFGRVLVTLIEVPDTHKELMDEILSSELTEGRLVELNNSVRWDWDKRGWIEGILHDFAAVRRNKSNSSSFLCSAAMGARKLGGDGEKLIALCALLL